MHTYNKIQLLNHNFFCYVFRHLLPRLQGELICTLKTTVTFCDYIYLQLLYTYLKINVFFQRQISDKFLVCITLKMF